MEGLASHQPHQDMPTAREPGSVAVGILHSLSGRNAAQERPLVDAVQLAIAEINQTGGVLGHQIQPILADGASDPAVFAAKARDLIVENQVVTLFGCWTSLSRKAVLETVEAHHALLWYPSQYEGLEQSCHIFYGGSCPNQQVEPAVDWLLGQGKRRIFLLGSDYVYPRTANKIVRGILAHRGGTVVAECYVPMGTKSFDTQIDQIRQLQADVVLNTLNGQSNPAFYQQFRAAGIQARDIPILAVVELPHVGDAEVGHYLCASYFQDLDTPLNQAFVQRFQSCRGIASGISDAVEAAYVGVYLWRQAVEAARSFAVEEVREAAYGQRFRGPGGWVQVDANQHLHKTCAIAQIAPEGRFEVVYQSDRPIPPQPWLGVEASTLPNRDVIISLLSEVSQGIQYSWELEQQSQQLATALAQVQQAQAALAQANEEITKLNQQLQTENLRMGAELDVTHRLQQMILPREEEFQHLVGIDLAGCMEPASEVGGDYFDVIQGEQSLTIGIGDVTGHGLQSGVVMLMAQAAVRTLIANGETDPARLLNAVNRLILDNTQRMQAYKNMTLALLEYKAGVLRLSGQHEELIIVRQDGAIEPIDTLDLGFPLGLESDILPFVAATEIHLNPGDLAVLYTDGVTEAMNEQREQYGLNRLYDVICRNRALTAAQVRQAILQDVRDHVAGSDVWDDITLVVLKQL